MYLRAASYPLSLLRFLAVCAVLLIGTVEKGYGQVYANGYGASQSGDALLSLDGFVRNPLNAIGQNSSNNDYVELFIGNALIGTAHAIYQLEFINNGQNLPAKTPVYVRLDDNTSGGLLGLALASNSTVAAYKNANSGNTFTLAGIETPLVDSDVSLIEIDGKQHLRIIPPECFNAIRISIDSGGLLGLLAIGNMRIYRAYYYCPEITVSVPIAGICEGEETKLTITNPVPCDQGQANQGDYNWYVSPTGGLPIGTGTTYSTSPLSKTTIFYVEYSGVDNSICGRTPVEVIVHPRPGQPQLSIDDVED